MKIISTSLRIVGGQHDIEVDPPQLDARLVQVEWPERWIIDNGEPTGTAKLTWAVYR